MSRHVRSLSVLALATAALLAACPKKGPGRGGAPGFDPVAAVPSDAIAVARLDVPTILARPALKDDQALLQRISEKVRTQIGIDPGLLRDATLFYAPIGVESMPRRGAAIISQSLRDSPGLGKLGAATDYQGRTVYRLGETATVTFFDGATVVGDFLSVQATIEALSAKRAVLGKDHVLWRVLDGLGAQPFRFAVKLAGFRSLLARLPVPGLDKIEVAGLGLDVNATDLVGDAVLVTADPVSFASMLKTVLANFGARLSASPLFKAFADLLNGVQVTTSGDRVLVSVKVPLSLVRSVVPLLLGTFGLN